MPNKNNSFGEEYNILTPGLHASIKDPSLEAVAILNGIINRYPDAVSFGPGAPYPGFLDDLDIHRYLQIFMRYMQEAEGRTAVEAKRRLFEYGPSHGIIRDLLAQSLAYDLDIKLIPASILVTVGCQEAMLLVLRALRKSEADLVAVIVPCYVGLIGAARLLDMEIISISEGEFGVDLLQLEAACKRERQSGRSIRAVYVAPDFSNPSGSLMPLETRNELLDLARREDFLIIEDSTYAFTAVEQDALPALKTLDIDGRVVYLGTFSKVCFPSVRVGFAIADQLVAQIDSGSRMLAEDLAALKTMVTVNTSPICQAIVGGMLLAHGGSMKSLSREKGAAYRERLAILLGALDRHMDTTTGVTWKRPAGGFFVKMRLPISVDAKLIEMAARKFGVIFTPMSQFYPGELEPNCIRLACSYLTPDQIEEGARRLSLFLAFCIPTFSPAAVTVLGE